MAAIGDMAVDGDTAGIEDMAVIGVADTVAVTVAIAAAATVAIAAVAVDMAEDRISKADVSPKWRKPIPDTMTVVRIQTPIDASAFLA